MEDADRPSVTGFCDPTNHVGSTGSDQQTTHGEPCWTTIVAGPSFDQILPPPGPAAVTPLEPVTFVPLRDAARFALVIDVSGSMAGQKLQYAKAGITYWLENLAVTGDRIAIVTVRSTPNVLLPLTAVDTAFDLAGVSATVNAVTASGQTNLRDGITAGIGQLLATPDAAAVQAVVLLTDGKHNRPAGSSVVEVQGDLQVSRIKLATIGLGPSADLDTEELAAMASATNGFASSVDTDGDDLLDVESAVIEAHLRLIGELVDVVEHEVVPPPAAPLAATLPAIEALLGEDPDATLVETLRVAGARLCDVLDPTTLGQTELADVLRVHTFPVEAGAASITASINFPIDQRFHLWLVGPRLREARAGNTGVHRGGSGPHRFCIVVTTPTAGTWRAVVLRRRANEPGRDRFPARIRLAVGSRQREIVTAAWAERAHEAGGRVIIHARAQWHTPLTRLSVTGLVRGPDRTVRRIRLRDGDLLSTASGSFTGGFRPRKPGRHQVLVRFSGSARALRADAAHLLAHTEPDVGLDLTGRAGRFQRVVPLTIDVPSDV